MKKKIVFALCFCIFTTTNVFPQGLDTVAFPIPPILKNNVAFWKKIYTEVSLTEGLLHDRDYPLVIYKKIDLTQRPAGSSRFIDNEKMQVITSLNAITSQPESTWTQKDKEIAQLYKDGPGIAAATGSPERIRFQLGQKERFKQGLERSSAYIDTIQAIFKERNIPVQLAFLPHVESSFNVEAYSKVGAAGLWQFMRGTGKLFLKINYLVDERRDPLLATVAAAKLLSQNYAELHSWPLAITAYNHGLNGMKRAEQVCGSTDISDVIQNYTSPSFQFASRNFYSCFLAAREIALNPKSYFSDLNFLPKHQFKTIVLQSFMRPSVLCKYLNVSENTLVSYNLSLRPVVFSQQKQIPAGFCIKIPADIAGAQAEKILAAVPDSLKSAQAEQSEYYTVQTGENLIRIASQVGISVTELANTNNITRKTKLFAGQVLHVPHRAIATATVALALAPKITTTSPVTLTPINSDTAIKVDTAKSATPPVVVAMAPQPIPVTPARPVSAPKPLPIKKSPIPLQSTPSILVSPPAETAVPAVQKPIVEKLSDSLKEISVVKAVAPPEEKQGVKPISAPVFDVSVYNLDVTLSPVGNTATIKVTVDETIGHYADWLGLPTYRIRQLNRLGAKSEIRINGKITIPANADLLAQFVNARLEYHMALEEDFYSKYKVTDARPKIIKRGEVLWNICNEQEQMPLWLFAKYNKHLDLGTLQPGMQVWMPVIEERTEQDVAIDSGKMIGIYPVFTEPATNGSKAPVRRLP